MIIRAKRIRKSTFKRYTDGKCKKVLRGMLLFNSTWYGKTVTVMEHIEYVNLRKRLHHAETLLKRSRKAINEHFSA